MKVTVRAGQTLADIAIQEYGDLAAAFLISKENGISPTGNLEAGTVLSLPDMETGSQMQAYCHQNGISPATDVTADSEIALRVFTKEFTQQFI